MPGRKRKSSSSGMVTVLLILMPVGLIFLPTTVLLAVGMIPTVVAYVVDRDPDKTAPMTVGGLNFAGVFAFAVSLWQAGHTMAALSRILTDPFAWLVMYGAAGLGWTLYYGIPRRWQAGSSCARNPRSPRGSRSSANSSTFGARRSTASWRTSKTRSTPFHGSLLRITPADHWASRCSIAAFLMFFCSFSNARTSIWRTRSRLMP